METLYEKLKSYTGSDYYPFHMPGHKRNQERLPQMSAYEMDITEIDGFDNLHHAQGVLREAQQQAAALYESEEAYYLINGSTAGLLAAVCGTVHRGGKLLMARNCHKAVYHAVYLQEAEAVYLYAQSNEMPGLNLAVQPEQVRMFLEKDPEIEAVLITSPGYEGITSDVKEIAVICHRFGVPLIVDQAHGAHLGFHSYFPENAVREGADIVIHSLHKTLPSLTQTALIHLNGSFINRNKVRKYLSIYQTSSPSYVLMAGMEWCLRMLGENGRQLFSEYAEQLKRVRRELSDMKHIRLLEQRDLPYGWAAGYDPSKLVFSMKGLNHKGTWLYEQLLETYHLQMEMAAGDYVVAMTSVMDRSDGYERFHRALRELDQQTEQLDTQEELLVLPEAVRSHMCIYEAEEAEHRRVELQDSLGETAADYIHLYPPGVPLIVPGEEITSEFLALTEHYRSRDLELHGLDEDRYIKIVDKPGRSGRRCG